jgi:hypothetical protein
MTKREREEYFACVSERIRANIARQCAASGWVNLENDGRTAAARWPIATGPIRIPRGRPLDLP